jgi:hypothetical protein
MDTYYDKLIDNSVILNNYYLKNDYLRIYLLLITGVFMGYTLQPVPKWLSNLFDTSHTLKFFVLFISGCIVVYPVNKNNIKWVTVGSIITLIIFYLAR